jgi:hypothetical protein
MIKRILKTSVSFAAVCSLLLGTTTLAQTNTATNTRKEINKNAKQEIKAINKTRIEALKETTDKLQKAAKARQEELRAKLASSTASKKIKLAEQNKARAQQAILKQFNQFTNRIENLVKADVKIAEKLNSLSTSTLAYDLNAFASTTALYKLAQADLSKAKTDIAAAKEVALKETTASTSPQRIKVLVTTAQDSVKKAAKSYDAVSQSLKRLLRTVRKVQTQATTTTATTTTSATTTITN